MMNRDTHKLYVARKITMTKRLLIEKAKMSFSIVYVIGNDITRRNKYI